MMDSNQQSLYLREIATFSKGKPPAIIPYYGEDAYLYLNPEFLRGNSSAELAKPSSNSVFVDSGDLIILWDGSNAGEFFKGRKGLLASTMALIEHGEEFDKQYFLYALKSWESYLKGQTSGSGIPHVDKEVLGNLKILVFCKKEQEQIADILSTIDRAIAQTEAIIAKQQRIKTGLMQDLLTKGIDEHGNIRSEATHEFKDSAIGRIPVDWEISQIKSILSDSPKNGYSPQESDIWQGFYSLGLGCLTVDGFKATQLKQVPSNDVYITSSILKDGDFLIGRANTRSLVGLVGIYSDVGEQCIYPDLMVRLRFNGTVKAEYMEQVFLGQIVRRYIQNSAVGTSESMVKINAEIIKNCYFLKPNLEEQSRVVKILEYHSKLLKTDVKHLQKLNSQKTGLMQDLLTGKIRVTELLKEREAANP